ncbi:MAG: hypothetical protein ABIY52_13790 [Gemmatimonadaceae bacterium]
MSEQRRKAEEVVAGISVAAAAEASFRRLGVLEQEGVRRATVRTVARASRALSQALVRFADGLNAHADGVHCCANMDEEVVTLNEALADFIFATSNAAESVHDVGAIRPDAERPISASGAGNLVRSWSRGWPAMAPLPPIVHGVPADMRDAGAPGEVQQVDAPRVART